MEGIERIENLLYSLDMVELRKYTSDCEMIMANQIIEFWMDHKAKVSFSRAKEDIQQWTQGKNRFYVIMNNHETVGFIHLGAREEMVEWIEHIFVSKKYRNQGIGKAAMQEAERIMISEGAESIFMEVSASNYPAIKLYNSVGYNRLSLVTLRKDTKQDYETMNQSLYDLDFKIRKD